MGQKQSTANQKSQEVLKIEIRHPMFSNSNYIQIQDCAGHIKTEIRLANKQQFDDWQKRAKQVPENDSLMQPIQQYYESEGLCGDSGIAIITYNDYPYLLSDEIQNRKAISANLFQENQIWYLIYTILSATYNYHVDGRKTGDIRPDNIFINADGHVKVASVDSWPGEQTNYEKAFFEKTITYLSPQEIKDLQFGKVQEDCNKELAETFSVGLTVLDAAILTSSKDLYTKGIKLNYQKLEKRIEELRQIGYSEVLTLTIESMCEVDTEYRTRARQIFEWLQPHEEAIANLEDFDLEDYPQKMIDILERNQKIENRQNESQKVISSLASPPASTYIPTQLPTYLPTKIPTSFNKPSTIVGSLPMPSISSYMPSMANNLPSYDLPGSNYRLGYQGSLTYSQPQSSYLSSGFYETAKSPPLMGLNGQASTSLESHTFTLSKIDQQLEMSKRMFPE